MNFKNLSAKNNSTIIPGKIKERKYLEFQLTISTSAIDQWKKA